MHHDVSHLAHVDYSPVFGLLAGLSWVAHGIYQGLPPWSLVPALVFAAIAGTRAINDHLDRRQARRHAEELHRARMRKPLPFAVGVEPLD
jgi:hypothetical protein